MVSWHTQWQWNPSSNEKSNKEHMSPLYHGYWQHNDQHEVVSQDYNTAVELHVTDLAWSQLYNSKRVHSSLDHNQFWHTMELALVLANPSYSYLHFHTLQSEWLARLHIQSICDHADGSVITHPIKRFQTLDYIMNSCLQAIWNAVHNLKPAYRLKQQHHLCFGLGPTWHTSSLCIWYLDPILY